MVRLNLVYLEKYFFMHNDNSYLPGENDDKRNPAKAKTDPAEERTETPLANDNVPVGPFEHSGEVAGWTAVEEKIEKDRKEEAGDDKGAR